MSVKFSIWPVAGAVAIASSALAQSTSAPADTPGGSDVLTAPVGEPIQRNRPRRAAFGKQSFDIRYQPGVAFRENAGRDDRLGFFEHDLRIQAPLAQSPTDEWLLRARIGVVDSYGDAKIPQRERLGIERRHDFPHQLWDLELEGSYRHRFDNGWIAGATLSIGSPSDEPFSSWDTVVVDFTPSLRVPDGETNAWLFYLNLNNLRDFAPWAPLPGVGYEYEAGPRLSGLVGFPFNTIRYQPTDWLIFRGQYTFPRTVDAEFAVPMGDWEAFAGYEWGSDAYLWTKRHDEDDRLYSYEQKAKLGLRSPAFLDGAARLEVETGFAFQRYWFVGDDFGDRHDARLGVGDGPYARVQLRVSF